MPFPRSGPAVKGLPLHCLPLQGLSAAAMGALLLASAGKHFRDPGFFRDVVPQYLCRVDPQPGQPREPQHPLALLSREEWIALSGLLELAAAVGIVLPPSRKVTATALTGMFTAFLAGHIDALVRAYGPEGSPRRRKIHSLRLPLQAPLILWAWSLRRPPSPGCPPGRTP